MFLQLLEDKHFGKLDPKTVFRLANNNAEFSHHWLAHSIRSSCSLSELALAIAANIKWDTAALKTLESYLNNETNLRFQIKDEVENAVIYSKGIINNFCEKKQKKILYRLQNLTDSIAEPVAIDANKYTCHIAIKTAQINDILKSCEPHLKDVSLFGGEGKNSKNSEIRNNTHFPTPMPNDSMSLALLENLLAKAAGLPIYFAEPPVVLRYLPEQYYKWHYDHIYPHTDDIKKHISHFGQRIKTAIFYLNDDFTGGETEFKTPFKSVIPEKNKALLFDNCDELQNRDSTSIHRGNSVITGKKWIVTLWFRNKPFWLRSGLL